MSFLPGDIAEGYRNIIGDITDVQPVSGGCINNGARITSGEEVYFIKWNEKNRFPGMFDAEADGLRRLAGPDCIRIPEVIEILHGDSHDGLLLEFIDSRRPTPRAGEKLGRQLAALHGNKAEKYGLPEDNYMGSLFQHNKEEEDLVNFFINQRLDVQLSIALDNGSIPSSFRKPMEKLYRRLPELLVAGGPSLIHGDLWGGNYLVDQHENPVLIDPAVAYGHPEMDIAMTRLFGGFPQSFYSSYQEVNPLESGLEDRIDIYNLYPLLVHVNLFGGGYFAQVKQIVSRFAD